MTWARKLYLLHLSLGLLVAVSTAAGVRGQLPPAFSGTTLTGPGGRYMHNYYLPPPSSTPFCPAWSPTGEEIAFSMQGSIWKIKVGETVAYELTAGATYDSSPAWSPDGEWIVYTAEVDSKFINLRILNVTTGETRPLTDGESLNLDPVWSPDGKPACPLYPPTPDGWFNIYVLDMKDGQPGKRTRLTTATDYGSSRLYFGRNGPAHRTHMVTGRQRDHLSIQSRYSARFGSHLANAGRAERNGEGHGYPSRGDALSHPSRLVAGRRSYHLQFPTWAGNSIIFFVLPAEGGEPYKMTFGEWDHFHPRFSPDGHRIAYISNRPGVSELRILETFSGKDTKVPILQKRYRRPMGWLKVQVIDSDTGQQTAARIYARASDHKTYVPEESFQRIGRLGEHLFHTDGEFVVQVPPGRMTVEAVKGFEFFPASQEVNIEADKLNSVALTLRRMTDLSAKGWYSGSTHVHMNYGGNLHNTPENLMFMSAAEDMDIIGELVANKDNRIFDYQFFRGELDPLSTSERLLYFNEEYRPPFYGHIGLLNLREHLISPFTTGYEGTAIDSLYPSNTDIFRIARKQGAIGGYVHPYFREPSEGDYGRARGFPVDTALGTLEFLEVMSVSDHLATASVWHRILNCGFRVTAVGGEDSISNLHRTALVGADRTYAYLGPKLDWDVWIEAIRRGRTFVTNGPLLEFSLNGAEAGEEIHLPESGGRLKVRAAMQSIAPVEKVEILNNGKVVSTLPLTDGGKRAETSREIHVMQSGWYTLRAYSRKPTHPVDDRYPFAETSPIYVYVGDRPIRSAEDARYFITWIDAISRMAAEHPGWRSEKEKAHVLGQFREARRVFEQREAEGNTHHQLE